MNWVFNIICTFRPLLHFALNGVHRSMLIELYHTCMLNIIREFVLEPLRNGAAAELLQQLH